MPRTLVETPTFDPSVVVPVGTDTRSHASSDVAAIAQALANRTQSLKVVTDVAAVKNAPNTFAAAQTFNDLITANGGITAADGTVELIGGFAVSAAMSTGGPITIVDNTKDVAYSTRPARYVNIPMSAGISSVLAYNVFLDCWEPSGTAGAVRFPVTFPRGAMSAAMELVWRADASGNANSAELYRNTQAAWSLAPDVLVAPTAPALAVTIAQGAGFSATQCTRTTFFLGDLVTVDNATTAYFVNVVLPNGANNALFGLRIYYADPGARNG